MTRGGAAKRRDEPERRCVATGESGPTAPLIRFVLDPEGRVTPDLAERLPGRGVWVTASRPLIEKAAARGLFARGFRRQVSVSPDLADMVESLLTRRLIEAISLARKAGLAVAGFEKVKARLGAGPVAALLAARDGAADGRRRLAALAGDAPVLALLDAGELGLAFGRDSVVHAALGAGGAANRVLREAGRLDGLRLSG